MKNKTYFTFTALVLTALLSLTGIANASQIDNSKFTTSFPYDE